MSQQQQTYYDVLSQLKQDTDNDDVFYDALSTYQEPLQNAIVRKRKKGQKIYLRQLMEDNMKHIRSCFDMFHVADSIVSICKKNNITDIFIVDGPNIGYYRSSSFHVRQSFLASKHFRNMLDMSYAKDNAKLFVIVSQNRWIKKIKKEDLTYM